VKTKFCNQCQCLDPDNQGDAAAGCAKTKFKGDGNCDDNNNNEGCDYDGGDCCPASVKNNKGVKTGTVKKTYCTKCECLDPDNQGAALSCFKLNFKGDGNCDDKNNDEGCEWDGGDCCAATVTNNKGVKTGKVKTTYCTECKCLDPAAVEGCWKDKFKGDGNCDDKNNNGGCEYDGGDCCVKTVQKDGEKTGEVKTKFCQECKCLDPNGQ